MEETQFLLTDSKSIWSQIKRQNKQIQLKRRWLLGLTSSEHAEKKSKRENNLGTRSLPESLIREDDIFYDTVKSRVEEAFGIRRLEETEHQQVPDDLELPDLTNIPRAVLSCFDNLTAKGLYLLAQILTGGRAGFDKTRSKMKKVVRESLLLVYGPQNCKSDDDNLKGLSREITRLVNDPQNFRDNNVPFLASKPVIQRAAAKRVLERLGSLPLHTLVAMHKKLKEVKQSVPRLDTPRNGWNRSYLIKQVRKNSEKLMSKVGVEDQLPGSLAKAMAVASLSLKLMPGFHNSAASEFSRFSPETEALQTEITKAIWLVKTQTSMAELKIVKSLLDPDAKVSNRCLRTAIMKTLIEYLYWCSDMDTVPKPLFETLAVINKKSRRTQDISALKNEFDDEIEGILNVSAHTKQNLLDLLPIDDFYADFTDAYMEDLEESDDEFGYVDNPCDPYDEMGTNDDNSSQNSCSNQEVESTGDSVAAHLNPNNAQETCPATPSKPSSVDIEVNLCSEADDEPKESNGSQTICKNQYLAIQEVCDETSMITYSLIGRLLEEFGRKQGLDLDWSCSLYLRSDRPDEVDEEDSQVAERIRAPRNESDGTTVVRSTQELIPSFPESGIERLKKLLGSS